MRDYFHAGTNAQGDRIAATAAAAGCLCNLRQSRRVFAVDAGSVHEPL